MGGYALALELCRLCSDYSVDVKFAAGMPRFHYGFVYIFVVFDIVWHNPHGIYFVFVQVWGEVGLLCNVGMDLVDCATFWVSKCRKGLYPMLGHF